MLPFVQLLHHYSLKVIATHTDGESAGSHEESACSNWEYSAAIDISSFSNLSAYKVVVTLELAKINKFSNIAEVELCCVAKAARKNCKLRNLDSSIPCDIYKLILK